MDMRLASVYQIVSLSSILVTYMQRMQSFSFFFSASFQERNDGGESVNDQMQGMPPTYST